MCRKWKKWGARQKRWQKQCGGLCVMFVSPSGCYSGYKATSPFLTAMAEAAAAAAAAAVGGCATQTPRAWCHGSPSFWTSCTPRDSTSTRPGMSASFSWTSASSSACLNRTRKRSGGGEGRHNGNPYPLLTVTVGSKPANTNKNLITLTRGN